MSTIDRSQDRRGAVRSAQVLERNNMNAAGRFGLGFIFTIVGCATILPFFTSKKTPTLTEGAIYVLLELALLATWMLLGYHHSKRISREIGNEPYSESSDWSNTGWGGKWEILIYYGLFFPLVFILHYWGNRIFGFVGFNHVLLFVLAAMAAFVNPAWMVVITLCLIAGTMYLVYGYIMGYWFGLQNFLGVSMGMVFGAFMYYMLNSQIRLRYATTSLADELDQTNAQLRAYSAKAEELSATQERNRIAREIHDTLGHSLTVVNVQLEAAKALISTDLERASQFIDKAKQLTQQGLQDVRESVSSLRSSPLDGKTVGQALQEIVRNLQDSGVKGSLAIEGEERELSPQITAAIYRTAQEASTNIRKHSKASSAEIVLDYRDPSFIGLQVKDDGIGCQDTDGGFGILGIQERIQFLNGKTQIKTSTGEGFGLEVTIPV